VIIRDVRKRVNTLGSLKSAGESAIVINKELKRLLTLLWKRLLPSNWHELHRNLRKLCVCARVHVCVIMSIQLHIGLLEGVTDSQLRIRI